MRKYGGSHPQAPASDKTAPSKDDLPAGESVFTGSIKQQTNRHMCRCGKIGCTEHAANLHQPTPPSGKKQRDRVKELAEAAAKRGGNSTTPVPPPKKRGKRTYTQNPSEQRHKLKRERLDAIRKGVNVISQPHWHRHAADFQEKTLSALEATLHEILKADSSESTNPLVAYTTQLIAKNRLSLSSAQNEEN